MQNIRNFVITAHIDHGKSTLADRMLELTKTVEVRKMHAQYLDTMGLEQERGITIKMQPVTMMHQGYHLNLIDTPGHVDFGYEVSRALAAVEGAILLVDATKGVQAQTLANLEQAILQDLVIIPAINKIDLPQARPEEVKQEIAVVLGADPATVLEVSAKDGTGVAELLQAVIARVPSPSGKPEDTFSALIFDSHYDDFRGVIAHVRVINGSIGSRQRVQFLASGAKAELIEAGVFTPELKPTTLLAAGEIGYLATGLKDPHAVRIGDTVILQGKPAPALPGYGEPHPVVYAAMFPEDADDFDLLKDGLLKLQLNDAALTVTPEESHALGRGFRCGFLGTLHLEIVIERLRREAGLALVVTHPSVVLTATTPAGRTLAIKTPRDFPEEAATILEPWVRLDIIVPPEHLSAVIQVISETRGVIEETKTVTPTRLEIRGSAPLLDVVEEFADRLKSATSGYASFSFAPIEPRPGDLLRLRVLVAHEEVEALTKIVPKNRAEREARAIAGKLKDILPPQLFAIAIQVATGTRVIARETIPALRKNVTEKLYGGDFTRKKKLLVKQRKGKKRMEKSGRVEIPSEVYVRLLKK